MTQVVSYIARQLRLVFPAVLTGVGYYLTAATSLFLTRGTDGIAAFWPSSGVLLAALLIVPQRRAGLHIMAAAIASLTANLSLGNPPYAAVAFTVANMVEPSFAAWLLRTRLQCRLSFTDPRGLACFCMAAMIGIMVGATVASVLASMLTLEFWFSWFVTDLLGAFIVTPLLLIIGQVFQRDRLKVAARAAPEMVAILGMVTLVTGLTFWQTTYPLLFLPMLAVLVAAFRLGPFGAAGSVLIVAVVGSVCYSLGYEPSALAGASTLTRSLFLQGYLLALFAAALPVAALLAAKVRLVDQLAEKMRLLQLAESAAKVGHWRLDPDTGTVAWSPEVFRIHGIDEDSPPQLDAAILAYHVDDRARVAERMQQAISENRDFSFTARIIRPDGEVRHVFSRGEVDKNAGDAAPGLFGIIQDITAQVEHEAALEAARVRAEDAAAQATVMAQTDQLTGIANRRRTSVALEQAIDASGATGEPLSVVMFDIDHFKAINDTYGHQAGDEVLKRVVHDAGDELRRADTLGRFGGEEFVIVLPDTSAPIAMMVAERVRTAIEAGGVNPSVTISVGVAELASGETSDAILRRADQALYVAKRAGRNALRLAA